MINAYLGSSYLPNKKFPVVFHAVYGKDDREASSPSFFNIDEATQVKLYVDRLKEDRVFRTSSPLVYILIFLGAHTCPFIEEQDIGVITPYHAQCQRIRRLLGAGSGEVKVGSVEEFQGQVSEGVFFNDEFDTVKHRNEMSSSFRLFVAAKSSSRMIYVTPLDLLQVQGVLMVGTCLTGLLRHPHIL